MKQIIKSNITRLSIQIPSEIAEKISEESQKKFITKSQYIYQAVLDKIKNDKIKNIDDIVKG